MTPHLRVALVAAVALGVGCKKKWDPPASGPAPYTPPPTTPAAAPAPSPSGGGGGNTNYQYGGGAVQNVRQAGRRTVALNDMQQLGQFITQLETETGKMPTPAEVKEYIRRDAPKVVAAIDDGTIVLTGTRDRGGLWAYEVDADKVGGIGLAGGTASRMTADQVQQLLARK